MAGVAVSAQAQSVPRPNFAINWHPSLAFNLWPADFNKDGKTDLVAGLRGPAWGAAEPVLVVAIGRGDGTFLEPVSLGLTAYPLNVGDMNNDGSTDVVISNDGQLQVLPGRGNGTFAAPETVAPFDNWYELRVWAHTADIDGDGNRDIFVTEPADRLRLYRGNGDFTFRPAIELTSQGGGYQPTDATSGDFNGDGRRDIAVATPNGIDVLLQTGSATFTASFIPSFGPPLTDVTTWDMNGDGRLDLIVSAGNFEIFEINHTPGEVGVLLGNGNGTFQAAARYPTGVQGAMSVVVGDFNGDGRLDAATGNRSAVYDNDLGLQYSDSVSILPGDGAGRLLTATTLALSYIPPLDRVDPRYPYMNFQHQLNTSDLDGNGRTDLIASPAATLLNRPAAANRPPAAFAGPDRTEFYVDVALELRGEGTDPDHHWLTYTWTDETGAVIGRLPWIRYYVPRGTTRTLTLTVNDGHGGVSSDPVTIYVPREVSEGDPFLDVSLRAGPVVRGVPYTVVIDPYDPGGIFQSFSLSYSVDDGRTFTPVPGCQNLSAATRQCVWQDPGPLTDTGRFRVIAPGGGRNWIAISPRFSITAAPPEYASADIGAVGAAGTTGFAGGTWTIAGSGADIWGTADEFRFVSQAVTGTFTFTARVASIQNLDRWVKAGIMIREDLSAGSRHASLFATPTTERGIAFQRRTIRNGISTHTAGPAVAPPGWLRLGRIGDTISAYYRPSISAPWVLVGRETIPGLSASVRVGLAVSSHVDGRLATATFDNVGVATELLERFQDVGAVGVAGSLAYDGVVHEVRASGADIWGTADAFGAVRIADDFGFPQADLRARVRSVDNTYPWAKAGVMFRDGNSGTPGVAHVMVVVTPGRGVAMQYRPTDGAASIQAAVVAGTAPEWVRLTRSGNRYTGYASEDGITWRTLGTVTAELVSPGPLLAVTSHDNTRLTRAVFENVEMKTYIGQ